MTASEPPQRFRGALAVLLLANIAAHLSGIGDPILGHHAWRQADTAALARNYLEIDANFFRPRIDYLGNPTGITGSELPIYSYLVHLGYRVGGESLVWARVVTIAASCVAIGALFAIAAAWTNRLIALASAFLLACSPTFFHYGRNIQPDVSMVAFGLAGLACWLRWEQTRTRTLLGIAIACTAIATMIKPYALMMVLPMLVMSDTAGRRWSLLMVLCAVGSTVAWYGYALHLTSAYGGFHYFGEFLYDRVHHPFAAVTTSVTSPYFLQAVVLRGIRKLWVGYVGAGFLLIGAASLGRWPARVRTFLLPWIALGVAWLCLAGDIAAVHEYYALPLIPAVAIVAGLGVERVWSSRRRELRFAAVLLLGLAPVLPVRHSLALRGGNLAPALVNIADQLDALIPRNARIVIGPDGAPSVALYHAHRRGWRYPPHATALTLGELLGRGATFLVSNDREIEARAAVAPHLRRYVGAIGSVRVYELGDPPLIGTR